MVGVDAVAVAPDVVDVVGAGAGDARRLDDVDAVLGVSAAVPDILDLLGEDLAVRLAHAGLEGRIDALADIRVLELLLTGVGHLDRAPAVEHRERDDDAFEGGARLGAEAAADIRGDDPHLVERDVEGGRQRLAHREGGLATRPHGELSVRLVLRDGHMRLDGHVLDVRDIEGVLRDVIRLGKALVDVALAELVVVGDVGARHRVEDRGDLVGAQVGMDERRVRLHALDRVGDRRQLLVLHLDQLDRRLRDVQRLRRHRRDGFAAVFRGAHREEVFVLEVEAAAFLIIVARDDALHARQLLRLRRVDAQDFRVRVGAALHLGVEHPGHPDVVHVFRLAGDLLDAVNPVDRCSDCPHLRSPPSVCAATSSMASMIRL